MPLTSEQEGNHQAPGEILADQCDLAVVKRPHSRSPS